MSETVIIKPFIGSSALEAACNEFDKRWQRKQLGWSLNIYFGKNQEQPIDQSPNRGSGWMAK